MLNAVGDDASNRERAHAVARLGEELFNREWVAGDARSPGGDGLGPVYNETSCVACHNLGGAGGAGPSTKNIVILSAIARLSARSVTLQDPPRVKPGSEKSPVLASMFAFVRSENERLAKQPASGRPPSRPASDPVTTREPKPANSPDDTNVKGHPGFNTATSVTLHRFGTNPAYESWRMELLGLGKFPRPRRISDEKTGNQRFGPDPGDVSAALSNEMMARGKTLPAIGPVRRGVIRAQHHAAFWLGADRRHPRRGDRGRGRGAGRLEDIPRNPWPRQPPCRRKDRSLRLEGADGEPRGFRIDRVRRRAGAGGARSSPITRPAGRRKKGAGPRPVRTTSAPR